MSEKLKPGYLPIGAARLFAEALDEAELYDRNSPERWAIFDMVHARVRFLYPEYFLDLPEKEESDADTSR